MDCNENYIIQPGARSPKKAYVVLIGLTGAGKSTTLNALFDGANCQEKKQTTFESATSDILEYSVLSTDMNKDLVVIDTPGFGDTRGIKYDRDSKVMATLERHLGLHNELSKCFPTAVLLVVKFDDRRIQSEASYFVQMLKALNLMVKNGTLVDTNELKCNLIVVLTHFMSENDSRLRQNPEQQINLVRHLIKSFTSISGNIKFVMAENKGKLYKLKIVKNYFEMPNGEYYPYNLFEAIQNTASDAGDETGEEIIVNSYKNPEVLKKSLSLTVNLLNTNHPHVKKFRMQLEHSESSKIDTEIYRKLQTIWDKLLDEEKNRYIYSLSSAQTVFQEFGINTINQLPETNLEILNLLSSIPMNRPLEKAILQLGINPPRLDNNKIGAGFFYNIKADTVSQTASVDLAESCIGTIGFFTPKCIQTDKVKGEDLIRLKIYNNKIEYVNERLIALRIPGSSVENFQGQLKDGFNIVINIVKQVSIIGIREHRKYEMRLSNNAKISERVKEDITRFGIYNEASQEKWANWFEMGYSHFVRKAYLGGYVKLRATLTESHQRATSFDKIIEYMHMFLCTINQKTSVDMQTEGWSFEITYHGGDQNLCRPTYEALLSNRTASFWDTWIHSLNINPILLESDINIECFSALLQHSGLYAHLERFSDALKAVTGFDCETNKFEPTDRKKVQIKKRKKKCMVM